MTLSTETFTCFFLSQWTACSRTLLYACVSQYVHILVYIHWWYDCYSISHFTRKTWSSLWLLTVQRCTEPGVSTQRTKLCSTYIYIYVYMYTRNVNLSESAGHLHKVSHKQTSWYAPTCCSLKHTSWSRASGRMSDLIGGAAGHAGLPAKLNQARVWIQTTELCWHLLHPLETQCRDTSTKLVNGLSGLYLPSPSLCYSGMPSLPSCCLGRPSTS